MNIKDISNNIPDTLSNIGGLYKFSIRGLTLYIGQARDFKDRLTKHFECMENPSVEIHGTDIKYQFFNDYIDEIEWDIIYELPTDKIDLDRGFSKVYHTKSNLTVREENEIIAAAPLFNIAACPWKPNTKMINKRLFEEFLKGKDILKIVSKYPKKIRRCREYLGEFNKCV